MTKRVRQPMGRLILRGGVSEETEGEGKEDAPEAPAPSDFFAEDATEHRADAVGDSDCCLHDPCFVVVSDIEKGREGKGGAP